VAGSALSGSKVNAEGRPCALRRRETVAGMNINEVGQVPGNVSKQSSFRLNSTYSASGRILLSNADLVAFECQPIAADYVTLTLTLNDPTGNWSGVQHSRRFDPADPNSLWIVQVDTIPPTPAGSPASDLGYDLAMTGNQDSSPSDWYVAIYA
jgi:hypothetical protein